MERCKHFREYGNCPQCWAEKREEQAGEILEALQNQDASNEELLEAMERGFRRLANPGDHVCPYCKQKSLRDEACVCPLCRSEISDEDWIEIEEEEEKAAEAAEMEKTLRMAQRAVLEKKQQEEAERKKQEESSMSFLSTMFWVLIIALFVAWILTSGR